MIDFNTRLEVFEQLLLSNGNVYLWRCDADANILSSNCPAHNFLKNIFMLSAGHEHISQHFNQNKLPVLLNDDLGLLWIAASSQDIEQSPAIYLIGPVLNISANRRYAEEQMDSRNMSVKSRLEFINIINDLPIIPTINFIYLGRMLYNIITQKQIVSIELITPISNTSPSNITEIRHNSYENELRLLQNVENGNIHYQETIDYQQTLEYNIGELCPGNPLRQAKDEGIIYTALCTRAAIRGGYYVESAYSISDFYIQAVENCTSVTEVYATSNAMYNEFVYKVHDSKQNCHYSDLVNRCIALMDYHIYEQYSLATLAKELGYSKYYLSSLFKSETGESINDFMRHRKIAYAQRELQISNMDIAEIAEKLHFSSPSYFCATFRKETGMTPNEFREQVRQ